MLPEQGAPVSCARPSCRFPATLHQTTTGLYGGSCFHPVTSLQVVLYYVHYPQAPLPTIDTDL